MIRTIEELSMNAWPALQTLHYDGWVLRSTQRYSKRANSVYPLYASNLDLDKKIRVCESFYEERNQPTVFKMTTASMPPGLDAHLAEHGYLADGYTSVQLMELSRNIQIAGNVNLTAEDSEAWHAAYARMNNVSAERRAVHEGILRAILPDKCHASISVDGRIIACGLGVAQADYLGIFDIVVDANRRKQKHGENLMTALLGWGIQRGSHTAYLQVMCDNEPALRLYEKLGFEEKYQYWYRIKA